MIDLMMMIYDESIKQYTNLAVHGTWVGVYVWLLL
jgi:hypothetical protein